MKDYGVRVFLSERDRPYRQDSMRQRSSYPKPFKAQGVQECLQPGASISSVAISHSINANVIANGCRFTRAANSSAAGFRTAQSGRQAAN
jgi:transposase-like protein